MWFLCGVVPEFPIPTATYLGNPTFSRLRPTPDACIRMAWPASMGPREATTHGYTAGDGSFDDSNRDAEPQQSKYLKRRCRSTSCHGRRWIALGLLLCLVPSGALVYSPRLISGGAVGGRSSCGPSPTMGCGRSNARGHWLMASPRGVMLYLSQQTTTSVRRLLACFHSQLRMYK